MANAFTYVKERSKGFFAQVAKTSELSYLTLLTLYVMTFYILRICVIESLVDPVKYIRVGLLSLIMWGSALYLLFVIIGWKNLWKKTIPMILIGAALLGATAWFSNRMTTNAYNVVMDIFFCLMACGKSYKKILRNIMFVAIGTLVIAAIGRIVGFTYEAVKPDNASPGHSFGIIYPNTWGYIAFVALMIAWYLYLRKKPILTFVLFWGSAVFMFFVISCRTIAVLAAGFPVLTLFSNWIENRESNRQLDRGRRFFDYILIAMPFLFLLLTLVLCWQLEWVHKQFYYTALHTLAMRFVQGGLFLRVYGTKLIGNTFRDNEFHTILVNTEYVQLGILDNSFVSYLIMRGFLWVGICLGWQSIAVYRAVKRRDYGIPLLCAVILAYATMERPGLDVWFNFILLYPLAKVAGDPLEAAPAADAVEPSAAEASEAEVAPAPEPEEPAAELPSAEPVGSDAPEADQ